MTNNYNDMTEKFLKEIKINPIPRKILNPASLSILKAAASNLKDITNRIEEIAKGWADQGVRIPENILQAHQHLTLAIKHLRCIPDSSAPLPIYQELAQAIVQKANNDDFFGESEGTRSFKAFIIALTLAIAESLERNNMDIDRVFDETFPEWDTYNEEEVREYYEAVLLTEEDKELINLLSPTQRKCIEVSTDKYIGLIRKHQEEVLVQFKTEPYCYTLNNYEVYEREDLIRKLNLYKPMITLENAKAQLNKYKAYKEKYKNYPGSPNDDPLIGLYGYSVREERKYINQQIKFYQKAIELITTQNKDSIPQEEVL